MARTPKCVALAVLLLASPRIQAPARDPQATPAVDPTLFKGLQYRLIGPSRGGRITTVTGVPSQPRAFYMGA